MAPRSALANISFTVDSASEDEITHDELNALPTPDSNTENKAPARKARAKGAQTAKTTASAKLAVKSKPTARRASGGSVLGVKKGTAAVGKKAPAKGGRKALVELKDVNGSDTEEVDEFEDEASVEHPKPAKRGRPATKKVQEEEPPQTEAPARRGRKPAAKEPAVKKQPKSKPSKHDSAPEEKQTTIPETQPEPDVDPMDIEESIEIDEIPETMPPPPRPSARRAQAQSNRTRQVSTGRMRTGSASDSERDPVLRRKVGDLTRKLEAMTVKYDTLKEVASSGKDSNFEQLKRRTEQAAKGMSDDVLTLQVC